MNTSTSFTDQLRQNFHSNPIDMRVFLPDGSHAVVKEFKETNGLRIYRVQRCLPDGCYIAAQGKTTLFTAEDLRLSHFSVPVAATWSKA